MTVTDRRILYITFTVVFFCLAACILFFASGYRYDFGRRLIYRQGAVVLNVRTQPDRVFLDGKPVNATGHIQRFGSVPPGIHELRLEKEGYYSWKTMVTVRVGTATTLSDIALFRVSGGQPITSKVLGMTASPNGRYLLIHASDDPALSLLNTETGNLATLAHTLSGNLDDIQWNPQNDRFLVRTTSHGVQSLSVMDMQGAITTVGYTTFASDDIRWSQRRANHLLVLNGNTLSDVDLSTAKSAVLAEAVRDWLESGDTLFVLRTDGQLTSRTLFPTSGEQIVTDLSALPNGRFVSPSPASTLTILDSTTHRLALVRPGSRPNLMTLYRDVTSARWSSDEKRLAFSGEFELYLLDASDTEPSLIRRSSEALLTTQWIDDLPYLLVSQSSGLQIIDTSLVCPPISLPVGSGRVSDIFVNKSGGHFYIQTDDRILEYTL